ncbi:CAP-associated domain-containing protein [Macrococcus animalis]|uniref:CAP domain-containing protein n=1 Tax=Macrococcus animalis TaxID=3395467 RepID=UPI0039BE1A7B
MKQLLMIFLLLIFVSIFPLNILQLPDNSVLNTKSALREFIHEQQLIPLEKTEPVRNINVGKIKMGMSKMNVDQILGKPHMNLLNEYQQYWTIYHRNYNDFMLVMFQNGKVSGVYSNQLMIVTQKGIQHGMTRSDVEQKMGPPLKVFNGKNYKLSLDNHDQVIYQEGAYYISLYYDKFKNNTVSGIKVLQKNIDLNKANHYPSPNDNLKKDYARLHFELTNATRKIFEKPILKYHNEIAVVADQHAEDMAENLYFSHNNQQKETPFDRFKMANLDYVVAGENIAYGQVSPIEAHHGLMNSSGHRKNILKQDYKNLGVGIAFNNNNQPYYVENYITEK